MRSLQPSTRLRLEAWALLALAVLLGHGLLLRAVWPTTGMPALQLAVRPAATLVVRALILPQPEPPQPVMAQVPAPPRSALSPAAAPAAPATPPAPIALAAPEAAAAPPLPAADINPLVGNAEVPVYATRLPGPAQLHYRLQRGDKLGTGRLQWQRGEGGYELRLDVDWPGQPAQGSASRGLIDADGVAPLRHAELRRAREQRAVNFQRDAALITFSGPQRAYPLPPGAQDRLSWMIQLPAIVEANPTLARTGAVLTLFVAGTRGDAEAWQFEVRGPELLELPAGPVPQALLLRREPTRPYDTRIDVWLDPARQHLPVRAVFTTLPGGQPLQMELVGHGNGLEIGAAGPR